MRAAGCAGGRVGRQVMCELIHQLMRQRFRPAVQQVLGQQVVQHVGQEQGQAVGVTVQRPRQPLTLALPTRAQALQHIAVHLACGEGLQHQLLAQLVQLKLAAQCLQWGIVDRQVGWPKAGHQHPARGAAPARQVAQQADRRLVAPVQVFKQKQQRARGRGAVQQRAKFTQHAVLRGSGQLALQRGLVSGGNAPGQLSQPGGCGLTQGGQPELAVGAAEQLVQGLQHRQVGLTTAGLFNALAQGHREARWRRVG